MCFHIFWEQTSLLENNLISFLFMKQYAYIYTTILFFVILLTNITALAQNQCAFSLHGKILDLDDGKELEGTFVTLRDSNQVQVTNEHGSFKFADLCEGKYEILIQHVGCRDTIISVDVKKDSKITIKLPHSAIELSEIDIMDKQPDMIKTQTLNSLKEKTGTGAKILS